MTFLSRTKRMVQSEQNLLKGAIDMTFKELRMRKFRTAEEFARKAEIPTARVAKWESGGSAPKVRDLIKIAKVLGVSVKTLVESFEQE